MKHELAASMFAWLDGLRDDISCRFLTLVGMQSPSLKRSFALSLHFPCTEDGGFHYRRRRYRRHHCASDCRDRHHGYSKAIASTSKSWVSQDVTAHNQTSIAKARQQLKHIVSRVGSMLLQSLAGLPSLQ